MLWKKLDQAIRSHEKLYFWWREDDVGDYVSELQTILTILKRPMVLAVTPSFLIPKVKQIVQNTRLPVIQHGVDHINHAESGYQDEFPESIDYHVAADKILKAKEALQIDFKDQFLPVYAPPWLMIPKNLSDFLLTKGFKEISTYNPDKEKNLWNPDVDLINWSKGLSFDTQEYVLERLLYKLTFTNHSGFLCHHRTIGDKGFEFIEKMLQFFDQYENITWYIPPVKAAQPENNHAK